MTVTFKLKPKVAIDIEASDWPAPLPPHPCQEYYQATKAQMEAEATATQSDVGYYFKSYVSFSEAKPIKWEPHESCAHIKEDAGDFYYQVTLNARNYKKETGATGFKVVCFKVDCLNPAYLMQFVTNYCKEEWAPKTKVFINGPKKAPFPKKASGHF